MQLVYEIAYRTFTRFHVFFLSWIQGFFFNFSMTIIEKKIINKNFNRFTRYNAVFFSSDESNFIFLQFYWNIIENSVRIQFFFSCFVFSCVHAPPLGSSPKIIILSLITESVLKCMQEMFQDFLNFFC